MEAIQNVCELEWESQLAHPRYFVTCLPNEGSLFPFLSIQLLQIKIARLQTNPFDHT